MGSSKGYFDTCICFTDQRVLFEITSTPIKPSFDWRIEDLGSNDINFWTIHWSFHLTSIYRIKKELCRGLLKTWRCNKQTDLSEIYLFLSLEVFIHHSKYSCVYFFFLWIPIRCPILWQAQNMVEDLKRNLKKWTTWTRRWMDGSTKMRRQAIIFSLFQWMWKKNCETHLKALCNFRCCLHQ